LAGSAYEKVESDIIGKWLSPGDTAVDCGANVGVMTALMASRVGASGTVIAIEASAETCDRLEKVVQILDLTRVRILNRCICDVDGDEVTFHHDAQASEASSIVLKSRSGAAETVKVASITLDALVSRDGVAPALVKLDIEGAEPKALKGARNLLDSESLPLLIIECYPAGLSRLGFGPADILDRLPLAGYELWHVNFSWPNPAPEFPVGVPHRLVDPYGHRWPLHTNLIAIPRCGRFAARRQRLSAILDRRSMA
jgi:FkbM family methyltransferase